jgi:hypothetical protein
MFGYVRNNPLSSTDPTGRQSYPPSAWGYFNWWGSQMVVTAPTAVPMLVESTAHDLSDAASRAQWAALGLGLIGAGIAAPELVAGALVIANVAQGIQFAADASAYTANPSSDNGEALLGDLANYSADRLLSPLSPPVPGKTVHGALEVAKDAAGNITGLLVQQSLLEDAQTGPATVNPRIHPPPRPLPRPTPRPASPATQ